MGVGALNAPVQQRKRLAMLSRDWKCPHCKKTNLELLPDLPASDDVKEVTESKEAQTEQKDQVQSQTSAPESLAVQPSTLSPPSLPDSVLLVHSVPITQAADKTPPNPPNLAPTPTTPLPSRNDGTNSQPQLISATTNQQFGDQYSPNERPQQHQQMQMQAFPSFRNSATGGVPLWLDSAILILSVLLGGIMIHRVMF
jgi:ubiquitin-conjugating enzyme E2 J1